MGGTSVGADSILLAHTLAMVGDEVERSSIWQGWPVQMVLAEPRQKNASNKENTPNKNNTYGAL